MTGYALMIDLLKAELLRFRWWAAGCVAVQLVVLGFLTRVVDLAQQPEMVYQVFACTYGALGLLLGLYQMGGYRRPNTWLNLLHRPLAPWKIAVALTGAGAVLLAIGILLPALVVAGWQEWMTPRVVDTRHVLLIVSAWMVATCGYLAGCFVMLADRRIGFCAGVFLCLFAASEATGLGALLLQGLALAWLAAMVLVAFKPDLSAAPRGFARIAIIGAPLNIAMWIALVLVGFGVEFVWIAQGSHPNNLEVPQAGGEKELENAEGKDVFRLGLAGSTDPEAALWREQAKISEIFSVGPNWRTVPARGQLMNLAPMEFDDEERRVRWVFSHDTMRFEGYSLVDRRPAGALGVAGDAPFPAPVLPGPKNVLFDRSTVYQYDADARLVLPRARLPQGERLAGFGEAGDDVALLSDRALYFYDARELENDDGVLVPRQRVPLPAAAGDLQRIDAMELLDGWLLSFAFVRSSYNAEGALPFQVVLRVDESGGVHPVARRDITPDYVDAWRYQNWFPSPVVYTVQKAAKTAFADGMAPLEKRAPPVPLAIQVVAGVLMLFSLLGAVWRTRQTALSPPARIAWIVACGLISLPALMALWLLYPKRETVDETEFVAQPAIA
ncbi:putative membrane protein [Lysobacter dokdonensis DS-58]|uniref:Putative membrane protein n=1 Tax=Lysobacter dokdonensis DS-58 TaxID=1300345 RepID=A0A0A2WIW2_9GAMM|nr:hypothetical protein [Lysobacter dokdonensis]KGQ19733.1 putative membrane protein [Lysobacter dokdonensis DS-58]